MSFVLCLYPEHYRTLTPPVRSVVPKVPLLCVCAPPLSSTPSIGPIPRRGRPAVADGEADSH